MTPQEALERLRRFVEIDEEEKVGLEREVNEGELFGAKRAVDASGSPRELIAALEKAIRRDRRNEQSQTRVVNAAFAGAAFGACLMGLGKLLETDALVIPAALTILGSVFAGLIAFAVIKRGDVEDRKLALPSDILRVFEPELDPGASGSMHLDLRRYFDTERIDPTPLPESEKWFFERFRHSHRDWLTLNVGHQSGSRINLRVSTDVQRKARHSDYADRLSDHIALTLQPVSRELSEAECKALAARIEVENDFAKVLIEREGTGLAVRATTQEATRSYSEPISSSSTSSPYTDFNLERLFVSEAAVRMLAMLLEATARRDRADVARTEAQTA